MEKHRTIPHGYMTVGEVAKKMNTTVRTLQYYDKEGVLAPSAESEGGRRLYTDKDVIKLYQILSMKYLGFSLYDIKNRIIHLETPADVAAALTEQADNISEKITVLSDALRAIEALKEEVLQMQSVNFGRYADIIVNLQNRNEMYGLIKHFDDEMLDHVRNRFDSHSSIEINDTVSRLFDEAIQLKDDRVSPDSKRGQSLAKEFWDMIMKFTGGNMGMLSKMIDFSDRLKGTDSEWKHRQEAANIFIEPALEIYFKNLGVDPFGGGKS